MRLPLALLAAAVFALLPSPSPAAPPQERTVVVLLFDGVEPGALTLAPVPAFERMRAEGSFSHGFEPPFPTLSLISGFTISTGCWPAHHGIVTQQVRGRRRPALRPQPRRRLDDGLREPAPGRREAGRALGRARLVRRALACARAAREHRGRDAGARQLPRRRDARGRSGGPAGHAGRAAPAPDPRLLPRARRGGALRGDALQRGARRGGRGWTARSRA